MGWWRSCRGSWRRLLRGSEGEGPTAVAGSPRPGVLRSFTVVSTAPARRVTADEYLALERVAATKHELWDGYVFAMGGAGLAHNVIAANLTRLLGNLLVDRPCVVLPSDMKVHGPATDG